MTEVVYAIGSDESELVKIGRSANVPKRLADIQRMCPIPLAELWRTDGGCMLENALHRHFKDRRSHGEWFRFPEHNAVEIVARAADMLKATAMHCAQVLAALDAETARVAAEDAARVEKAEPGIRRELTQAVQRSHAVGFELDRMIVEEYAAGRSTRDIAAEAEMSHEWVRRLVQGRALPNRRRRIA